MALVGKVEIQLKQIDQIFDPRGRKFYLHVSVYGCLSRVTPDMVLRGFSLKGRASARISSKFIDVVTAEDKARVRAAMTALCWATGC